MLGHSPPLNFISGRMARPIPSPMLTKIWRSKKPCSTPFKKLISNDNWTWLLTPLITKSTEHVKRVREEMGCPHFQNPSPWVRLAWKISTSPALPIPNSKAKTASNPFKPPSASTLNADPKQLIASLTDAFAFAKNLSDFMIHFNY